MVARWQSSCCGNGGVLLRSALLARSVEACRSDVGCSGDGCFCRTNRDGCTTGLRPARQPLKRPVGTPQARCRRVSQGSQCVRSTQCGCVLASCIVNVALVSTGEQVRTRCQAGQTGAGKWTVATGSCRCFSGNQGTLSSLSLATAPLASDVSSLKQVKGRSQATLFLGSGQLSAVSEQRSPTAGSFQFPTIMGKLRAGTSID